MHVAIRSVGLTLLATLWLACSDRSAQGLARCEQLATEGKLEAAIAECERAALKSPKSTSGKRAQARGGELRGRLAAQREREALAEKSAEHQKAKSKLDAIDESVEGSEPCKCAPSAPLCSCL
ncbi:MAG: hypothetical protein KF718_02920 [Polyangiaceae bacterium]|nr:hypothetical protein [Polyangiaceae bacterium]